MQAKANKVRLLSALSAKSATKSPALGGYPGHGHGVGVAAAALGETRQDGGAPPGGGYRLRQLTAFRTLSAVFPTVAGDGASWQNVHQHAPRASPVVPTAS
jgi:hypothetical protein